MSDILEAVNKFEQRYYEVRKRRPKRAEVLNYFSKQGLDLKAIADGAVPNVSASTRFVPKESIDVYLQNLADNDDLAPQQPVAQQAEEEQFGPQLPERDPFDYQKAPSPPVLFETQLPALREEAQKLGISPVEELTYAPSALMSGLDDPDLEAAVLGNERGIETLRYLEAFKTHGLWLQQQARLERSRERQEAKDYFRNLTRKQPPPKGFSAAREASVASSRKLANARLAYDRYARDEGFITLRRMKETAGSVEEYLRDLTSTSVYKSLVGANGANPRRVSTAEASKAGYKGQQHALLQNLIMAQIADDRSQARLRNLTEEW